MLTSCFPYIVSLSCSHYNSYRAEQHLSACHAFNSQRSTVDILSMPIYRRLATLRSPLQDQFHHLNFLQKQCRQNHTMMHRYLMMHNSITIFYRVHSMINFVFFYFTSCGVSHFTFNRPNELSIKNKKRWRRRRREENISYFPLLCLPNMWTEFIFSLSFNYFA